MSESSFISDRTRNRRLRTTRSTQRQNPENDSSRSDEESEATSHIAHRTRNRRLRVTRYIQPQNTATDNIQSDEESEATSHIAHRTRNRRLRVTRSIQPQNTATDNIQSDEESEATSHELYTLPPPPPVNNVRSLSDEDSDETVIYEPRSPSILLLSPDVYGASVADLGFPEYNPTTPNEPPPGYPQSPPGIPLVENVPHSPPYSPDQQDPDSDVEIIEEETTNQQVLEEIPRAEPPPPAQPTSADVVTEPQSTCSAGPTAALNTSTVSEGEDMFVCSICMDCMTNSGEHRAACLGCGHVFGHSCIVRWIKVGCNNGARRCPTCNSRASLKEIRVLYLSRVFPLDTVERDVLLVQRNRVSMQLCLLRSEIQSTELMCKLNKEKSERRISKLEIQYHEALRTIEQLKEGKNVVVLPGVEYKRASVAPTLLHRVELSREGGCRVFALNNFNKELVVSQPSDNPLFTGFGVRCVNTVDCKPKRFIYLHQRMIRDMTFHSHDRNLLLSVSIDHTAKLFDLTGNTTIHTFKGENPLWSCCWDMTNPHLLLLGSQLGIVCQYDRRMMDQYVNLWETAHHRGPVVALTSAPSVAGSPFPQGGFISCRLNRIFTYSRHGEKYSSQELDLVGPFMSMRYENTTQSLFTTSRPSSRNPYAEICLNLMDVDEQGKICLALIHTFNCGRTASLLSRMNTIPVLDDTIVVGHHESGRTVNLWSTKSGSLMHSIPTKEHVIDLTGINFSNNKRLLAALSEKKLSLYKI